MRHLIFLSIALCSCEQLPQNVQTPNVAAVVSQNKTTTARIQSTQQHIKRVRDLELKADDHLRNVDSALDALLQAKDLQPSTDRYVAGQTYVRKDGKRFKYLGTNQWQELP